ncbi:MAG TPA: 30S ribosomal protein S4 [Euryarchaeota archaeon]|nr:30S ribosomal protein S4 [Euryarchaeota archaeon]
MGDPKFSRRKYDTPSHPWQGERIKQERDLVKRYGLKNKRELWKVQSMLRSLRTRSRDLQARLRLGDAQAEKETEQLLRKCGRLGLLPMEGATLNDILSLGVEDILTRRFQTMVFQKGLAYTHGQARQFIVHGHIAIGERKVTVPGYIVTRTDENIISFTEKSPISDDLHPVHPKPKEAVELEKEQAARERDKKKEEHREPEKKKELPKEQMSDADSPADQDIAETSADVEEGKDEKEEEPVSKPDEKAPEPEEKAEKAKKKEADDVAEKED